MQNSKKKKKAGGGSLGKNKKQNTLDQAGISLVESSLSDVRDTARAASKARLTDLGNGPAYGFKTLEQKWKPARVDEGS